MFPATVFLSGIYLAFPPFHNVVKQPWNGLPVPLDKSGAHSSLCWLLTLHTHYSPASERKRVRIGLGTLALSLSLKDQVTLRTTTPQVHKERRYGGIYRRGKGAKPWLHSWHWGDRDLMVTAGH